MVPYTINTMANFIASLHGDGIGLSAEKLGFQFTLFQ